jgi:hypothetical protein
MADEKREDGSPEMVAYKLMYDIAGLEGGLPSRQKLLDTYAECLQATRGYRSFPGQ